MNNDKIYKKKYLKYKKKYLLEKQKLYEGGGFSFFNRSNEKGKKNDVKSDNLGMILPGSRSPDQVQLRITAADQSDEPTSPDLDQLRKTAAEQSDKPSDVSELESTVEQSICNVYSNLLLENLDLEEELLPQMESFIFTNNKGEHIRLLLGSDVIYDNIKTKTKKRNTNFKAAVIKYRAPKEHRGKLTLKKMNKNDEDQIVEGILNKPDGRPTDNFDAYNKKFEAMKEKGFEELHDDDMFSNMGIFNILPILNRLLNWDGQFLKYTNEYFKNDKDTVLKATKTTPIAFEYASGLHSDKDCILDAIRDSGYPFPFFWASSTLKKDKDFIVDAAKINVDIFNYIDEDERNSNSFILDMVDKMPQIVYCFLSVGSNKHGNRREKYNSILLKDNKFLIELKKLIEEKIKRKELSPNTPSHNAPYGFINSDSYKEEHNVISTIDKIIAYNNSWLNKFNKRVKQIQKTIRSMSPTR